MSVTVDLLLDAWLAQSRWYESLYLTPNYLTNNNKNHNPKNNYKWYYY